MDAFNQWDLIEFFIEVSFLCTFFQCLTNYANEFPRPLFSSHDKKYDDTEDEGA